MSELPPFDDDAPTDLPEFLPPEGDNPFDPIAERNRQNAQHSTGPKTAEGKAVSSENATKHGYRSAKPTAPELALAVAIYGRWSSELCPYGDLETGLIMTAAQHEARRQLVHEDILSAVMSAAGSHREHRRRPFLEKIEEIQASIALWTIVRDDGFEPGEGLTADFAALLRDIDPKATPRNIGPSMEARQFAFFQNRAVATPRLKELRAKFARKKEGARKGRDFEEYARLQERLDKGTERLRAWIVSRIDRQIARLAEAEKALAEDDAQPDRPWAWYAESPEGRKLSRYHAEAENASRRYLKMFDDHRRRLIRTDLRRQQIDNAYGAQATYIGDIKMMLPARYQSLHRRAQLDTLVAEVEYEKHFYPNRQPNEASLSNQMIQEAGGQGVAESAAMSEMERQSQAIREYWINWRKRQGDAPAYEDPPR
ncbi:MAG: hypothetical protein U0800_07250 [Isosphaeraceae bacterium]